MENKNAWYWGLVLILYVPAQIIMTSLGWDDGIDIISGRLSTSTADMVYLGVAFIIGFYLFRRD